MSTGYYSVKETSEILGFSEQYVRKLLKSGDIGGERIGHRWIVASESANDYHSKAYQVDASIINHGRRSSNQPSFKALSFFSGCMGLDLGLETRYSGF
ncbi:MAG: helix-turn-helix domain-containing protein [Thermosynechococcaceae cyanobacterium MS004]|nr:helix-turn-helix domain-containing protein [Thermosynechococcaceae cyanobacterium MS004]